MNFGAYLFAFVGGFGVFCFLGIFGGGHVDIKTISFNRTDCGEQTHGKNNTTNPRQASLTDYGALPICRICTQAIINQSKSMMNMMKLTYESFTGLTLMGNLLIQQK